MNSTDAIPAPESGGESGRLDEVDVIDEVDEVDEVDEIDALARMLPASTEAALAPGRHRHHKDLLMRQIDHDHALGDALGHEPGRAERAGRVPARSPFLRPRLLIPVAAAALALATTAVVTLGGDGSPGGHPAAAAPEHGASVLLNRIAAASLKTDAPAVGGDQFTYVRSLVRGNTGKFGGAVKLGGPTTQELWLSQDPGAVTDLGMTRESGKDAFMPGQDVPVQTSAVEGSGDDGALAPGLRRPTYAWLASLPTDPDALLERLYAQVDVVKPETREQAVFDTIGDLLNQTLMPPRNAAAFYRAVARIPGVRVVPDAVDAAGRHGVGITLKHSAWANRDVWIFDPDSLVYLGSRAYTIQGGGKDRHEVLSGLDAVLVRAVVDHQGAKPKAATSTAAPHERTAATPTAAPHERTAATREG